MSGRGRVTVAILLLVVLGGGVGVAYSGWRRAPVEAAATVTAPEERVRVEVLNAGGVVGQAKAATDGLRSVGFDVVQFGNARPFDRDSSVVVDRVSRPEWALAVANALGIPNVLTEPDSDLFVDVTVLLGRDWSERRGDSFDSGVVPRRAPWDPRGWLAR